MLRQIAENLWVVDKPFGMLGIELGVRMTVIRLADGGLLLISPVPLLAEDREALGRLGTVRHLIAPNAMHHLFAAAAKALYPTARLHAAPGLPDRVKTLPYDEILTDTPPAAWAGEVDQHIVAGMPHFNEVAFLHRPSRTLILTDLAFNITRPGGLLATLFMKLNGALGGLRATRLLRTQIKDPVALRTSLQRILSWDLDRIIVAHGEILNSGGAAALRSAFAFLP